ncbi:MAG: 50S ribosomal protein L1 [Candidatus Micrarchaeia archaeon]|jgi:large subunit ribosomal protein L1
MDKKKLLDAISKALEDKGKKKFVQSVEFVMNFRGVDFTKPEQRLNLDIPLPNGKGGKEPSVVVIGDENFCAEAKRSGADGTILPTELPVLGADLAKLKALTNKSVFLAQPNQMGNVAKSIGQYLGPRGKIPKPLIGNMKDSIERTKRSVRIISKGKYLPVAHVLVGSEQMEPAKILENIDAVFEAVTKKVGQPNVKDIYVKLTMGKPVKVVL